MANINLKNNNEHNNAVVTMQPVLTGKLSDYPMEWGRTIDVQHTFGIKRGTLYNLFADRQSTGIVGKELRIRGKLKGVRIWNMDSIRKFIDSQSSEVDNIESPQQSDEQKNATLN